MVMVRYFFLIFTLIQAFESFSQIGQIDRFGMPMEVPLIVTAGYGEIRPDHFHSGIDFSTYGKSLPVKSIADGYVSRIRVSAFGYGNALYINHPSGFTSVYAHLSKFSPELNAYVKNLQQTAREYEVDAFPDSMQFAFKRNDIIGMTGNSGSSSAPHLHFEIRDQFFENTLNPLLFGYAERDITPPNMTALAIIPKKGEGKVNNLDNLISLPLAVNKKTRKKGLSTKTKMPVLSGWVGFGFQGGDVIGKAKNLTGIYSIRLLVDSAEIFSARFDAFSFDETRCVNAYMHYESKLKSGKKIHQCIVPENNMIGIYKGHVDRGYYYFGEDRKYKVKFILTDLAGNETIIDINVKGEVPKFEPASELKINPNQVLVKAGTEQDISIENQFEAHFEKESLFESAAIKLKKGSKINGSDVFELGSMYMPINQKMSIRINASNFQDSLKNRLIVMRKTGSKTLPLKSQLNDNWVETASGDFGDFWLAADTVAPSIAHIQTATKYKVVKKGRKKIKVPINSNETPKASGTIRFKISDRLSGISSVQATLNGVWFLLEQGDDPAIWLYKLPESLDYGCHIIHISATDNIGNKRDFELELEKNPVIQDQDKKTDK
jgi:hypothetical protein